MPVIALEVASRQQHPNADTLHLYELTAPDREAVWIIGNADAVYQTGDVVATALIGTVLEDGTEIRKVRLRGIDSLGMALGVVDDAPGTDLTARYARPEVPAELARTPSHPVIKWASIEQLHHVRSSLAARGEYAGPGYAMPTVTYRAKVKLDGTNGGVQILATGEVVAQSRSRVISVADDNLEFAAWVAENRSYFQDLARPGEHAVIFGEWCGARIQKRAAISQIDRRVFAVFAIQYGDHHTTTATLEVEPARIRARLPEHPDVFVLPWYGEQVTLDFSDRARLRVAAEAIDQMVLDVERCDPWVDANFGVAGVGEGLVLYPVPGGDGPVDRDAYIGLLFKAKGEKHQVVRQKRAAHLDPEVARSIVEFVDLFVTPARLEQGVAEACAGSYDMKRMGDFLAWFGRDVKKESAAELEASDLDWKDVSRSVMGAARRWYQDRALRGE